ncbi:MAG: tetratricopeptide repeat protein [Chitinophagaceae bacterium]|nr:tetratricopeptide repeat protein [Chitinophagaceae bacterium]MCW5929178.1 tetratricopeptide repeat protein [Chitinophagaceae bacterium]
MNRLMTFILLLGCFRLSAQVENKHIAEGNEAYKLQQFGKAAESYRLALKESPGNTTALFNLGNALYKNKQFDEAIKTFESLQEQTTDKLLQSKAVYNKGVTLTQQKKLEESIDAYKQVLRINPEDSLGRDNLQRALNEKKQQDQQQQQEQNRQDQQNENNNRPPPKNKLNKQQVEQLLKALEEQEKKLQEKVNKKPPVPGQPDKDW